MFGYYNSDSESSTDDEKQTVFQLMQKSALFHPHIKLDEAKKILESNKNANCFFTHGKNEEELTFYYQAVFNGISQVRAYTYRYDKKGEFIYPSDKLAQKYYQLDEAAQFMTSFLKGFAEFIPTFYKNSSVSTTEDQTNQNNIKGKVEEITERKKIVKSIIEPLFNKIKEKNPSYATEISLNLHSVDGIRFESCKKYTDDQYFIDVTFANQITIKDLFFDGQNLEIRGFGSDGKPLTLGLVKRMSDNIQELTKNCDIFDLLNQRAFSKP